MQNAECANTELYAATDVRNIVTATIKTDFAVHIRNFSANMQINLVKSEIYY